MTTSVTTIPLSQPATLPSSTSEVSYLNRCIKSLAPERIASFKNDAKKWEILSIVAIVAIPILALIACTAIGVLFFPVSIPFVLVGAGFSGYIAADQFTKLQNWSSEAQREFDKRNAIRHYFEDLNGKTPEQLQRIFLNMGIIWNRIPGMQFQHPEQLSRLNPVLAYAKYLEEHTQRHFELKNQRVNEAQQENNPRVRADQQSSALFHEYTALTIKIKNAFVNAVLSNPHFCGDLGDYGTLSKNTYLNQVFGNAFDDSAANQMFVFNNRNIAPITYSEAKTLTVAQLGQKFITAMAG